MRGQLPRLLALPLTAVVLLLPVAPALAQQDEPTYPTTPVPETKGEAPASAPIGPQPLGHAVGAAGTALGIARLLPKSQQTDTILPGFGEKLGKQALFEAGMILTSARANSEAYLSYERSIAQACPGGIAVKGDAPQAPGCVTQTALPDNSEPRTAGYNAPSNPLIDVGAVNGRAHARWSPTLGPCVGTIADASESLASLSLLPEIPSMGRIEQLTQVSDQLRDALGNIGPLQTLGGLLPGSDAEAQGADSAGGLISLPNTMSTRSTVRLVDIPDSENKAVQSISTLQLADVHLFAGTPLEITVKVVSQPTLTVTSTGNPKTSSVDYNAPVLAVYRGGEEQFTLDASNPSESIGMGIPTDPGQLAGALGMAPDQLKDAPVIGGLIETTQDNATALAGDAQGFVLDLFAIKLSIANPDVEKRQKTKPFTGHQIGASARMMNIEILPTEKLTSMLPEGAQDRVPPSLAQVGFGEQIARAYAPEGGVVCGTTTPAQPPEGGAAPGVPDELARTSAAYATVPLFWSGTGLLLAGVIMVSALPGRRRPDPAAANTPKPSPYPRKPPE